MVVQIVTTVIIVVAILPAVGLVGARVMQPTDDAVVRGHTDGQLAPCPATPNCVSSQADAGDETHRVEAIAWDDPPSQAIARIVEIAEQRPRTVVLEQTDDYVWIVERSALFRYADDLEFFVDGANHVIHVRSASRVGRGDMGVNRRRYEAYRSALTKENV